MLRLNEIAGRHGVGRIDIVENRFVGMKSRGVYETPGGTLLHAALRAVESITMDREVLRMRHQMALKFAETIYYGFWLSPEMKAMHTFVDSAMEGVTGTARLELYKGNWRLSGRKSPFPLYAEEYVTFEDDDVYHALSGAGAGSGACTGTGIPLDRAFIAESLGFDGVTQNSLDTVSDRDFILEYLAAATLCAGHCSRLAADLCLWSGPEYDFATLEPAYCTGSSMMPQKVNPDTMELVRAGDRHHRVQGRQHGGGL